MSHPYLVHLKNKYPEGHVEGDDSRIDAYDAKGIHRVALRMNGAGQMIDQSEAFGLPDRFDLSPIPKESRVWKLKNGKCELDELHASRRVSARKLADQDGKVPSIKELEDEAKEAALAKSAD
jgi:hypothetical protein